ESRRNHYYEYRPYAMISAMLTKKDDTIWSDGELFPILAIHHADPQGCGGYGPIVLDLKDGRTITVDYEGMEGQLCI
ncbi:MAG: hypothetical protein RSF83_09225, partial [Hungatella sp.]